MKVKCDKKKILPDIFFCRIVHKMVKTVNNFAHWVSSILLLFKICEQQKIVAFKK